ncbi:hypothetical protein [Schlesneria paludicola]|uniref:hypothetical protein n=1 Tax=Schlesneria paludicola TaxID=360056 RepID=UPI00029A2891|nr:hypothetical protein [Schlesneria paludicola]
MSDFKPLRRKLGIVTLILACAFMAGWIRSQTNLDSLFRLNQMDTHVLISFNGRICWERIWPVRTPRPSRWLYRHNGVVPSFEDQWEGCDIHWRVATLGFNFCTFSRDENVPGGSSWTLEFDSWEIPYWSIVIPLTAVSAYLLLFKSCNEAVANDNTSVRPGVPQLDR